MSSQRQPFQPLHPSVRDKLDPQYVELHDEILQYIQPTESQPWDPASREAPSPVSHAGMRSVEVGNVVDKDLGDCQIRIFLPEGEPAEAGWPCLVWVWQ